ncbi:unnamed protein product [Amoebophrya sp. A120]|nr:unnamed protein product [Amoebophrya sp. A120]|eukprot:GSA120T00013906001.1
MWRLLLPSLVANTSPAGFAAGYVWLPKNHGRVSAAITWITGPTFVYLTAGSTKVANKKESGSQHEEELVMSDEVAFSGDIIGQEDTMRPSMFLQKKIQRSMALRPFNITMLNKMRDLEVSHQHRNEAKEGLADHLEAEELEDLEEYFLTGGTVDQLFSPSPHALLQVEAAHGTREKHKKRLEHMETALLICCKEFEFDEHSQKPLKVVTIEENIRTRAKTGKLDWRWNHICFKRQLESGQKNPFNSNWVKRKQKKSKTNKAEAFICYCHDDEYAFHIKYDALNEDPPLGDPTNQGLKTKLNTLHGSHTANKQQNIHAGTFSGLTRQTTGLSDYICEVGKKLDNKDAAPAAAHGNHKSKAVQEFEAAEERFQNLPRRWHGAGGLHIPANLHHMTRGPSSLHDDHDRSQEKELVTNTDAEQE